MAGIEIRYGKLLNGDTNYGEENYGICRGEALQKFFRNSYYHIIKGEVVRNHLPLAIGDKGIVLKRGKVIYEDPVSGENGVIIEVRVI